MRIRVVQSDLARVPADLAVAFAHEGDREPRGLSDPGLRRELATQMRVERFQGRSGDQLVWNADGRYPPRRFLVLGLGPDDRPPGEALRLGLARAARAAAAYSAKSLAFCLPPMAGERGPLDARAAIEGALLGAYRFERHLTDPARRKIGLQTVTLAAGDAAGRLRRSVARGELAGRAVCLARDLVNEAPSSMNPGAMARVARRAAKEAGVTCRVLSARELERLGFRALLAVARGSAEPAHVVHLVYRPRGRARGKRRPIVLVGKGVTFDSGGLNIKPGDSMLHMKADMAGAAAVLATLCALPQIDCPSEVHGLLGLVENMTGGMAYKPGDILRTWSGKTVEVGDTDAEGRLVLCDLLAWAAAKLAPRAVVDLATLTGSCVVALGPRAAGLFTRDDALAGELLEASRAAGEKVWRLPLYDEYLEFLQKGPADLCNVGGRWGGAITAALFLGEFVPRSLAWAHLDIAGPAFAMKDQPDAAEGGTGAGVLTLLRWLERA